MKRARFGALTLGAVAAAGSRPARAQSAPFRFGVGTAESFALAYYAAEAGFFKKQGLDVEVVSFPGGGAGLVALAGGAVDYACGSWVATANAHARGVPVEAFAAGAMYATETPTMMLAVAKDNASIRTGKDLNGKTISVSTLRDIQQAAIMKWIDTNGGDSRTVKFIEMPTSESLTALNAGRIDAASFTEPVLTSAKNGMRLLTKAYDMVGKHFMITAHFALREYLDRNVAQTRKVVAALSDTAAWANANQDKAGALLARLSKLQESTIAAMARTEYAGKLDVALVQPVIAISQRYGFVDPSVKVNDLLWTPPRA